MDSHTFVDVSCQVCGSHEADEVYSKEFETIAFGRVARGLWLCASCGFLYSTPRPSPEALELHYRRAERAASVHDACSSRSGEELAEPCRIMVERFVEREARGRWLDVGCAHGELLARLDLPSWNRLGLEPSPTLAARARERGLSVIGANLEQNPLATESFDLVTCISVLEHVWDVRAAMATLERLLVRGGHAVLHVPDATRPRHGSAEFYTFEHLSHFSPGSLAHLLREFGLQVLDQERTEQDGILVCARKDGRRATLDAPVPDDREEVRAAVELYRAERLERERPVREELRALRANWRAQGTRVGVLGADEETQYLLELVDIGEQVVAVFDADEEKHGKRFLRWRIKPTTEIEELGLDVLLVAKAEMAAQRHGLELVSWGTHRRAA